MSALQERDPRVAAIIASEQKRQTETLEIIASENYASAAVLEATGSVLTNKYAEGYPGKRYYAGNAHSDEVESLAIERAKALFGAEHANVQPTSGAEANMAAYLAFADPGDTFLGLELTQGGHLTHGSPVNFSGRLYNFVPYSVDRESEVVDMATVAELATEAKPRIIVTGPTRGSSTSRHSPRLRGTWGRCCWSTCRTSRGWWRAGCTPRRCPTRTS